MLSAFAVIRAHILIEDSYKPKLDEVTTNQETPIRVALTWAISSEIIFFMDFPDGTYINIFFAIIMYGLSGWTIIYLSCAMVFIPYLITDKKNDEDEIEIEIGKTELLGIFSGIAFGAAYFCHNEALRFGEVLGVSPNGKGVFIVGIVLLMIGYKSCLLWGLNKPFPIKLLWFVFVVFNVVLLFVWGKI